MKLILTIDTDKTPGRSNNLNNAIVQIKSALKSCKEAAKRGVTMAEHNVGRWRNGCEIAWSVDIVRDPKRVFAFQHSTAKGSMNHYVKIWEIVRDPQTGETTVVDVIPRTCFQYQTPHQWVVEKLCQLGLVQRSPEGVPSPKYVQNFQLIEM